MASPQLENGYTRIANELLDALARVEVNGTQAAIIFAVIRETYGFGRKTAALGASMIAEMTGRHRTRIALEIQKLIARGIITEVSPASFGSSRTLALNKNYNAWAHALSTDSLTVNGSATVNEIVERTVNGSVDETVNGSVDSNSIKKPIKETSKESISPPTPPYGSFDGPWRILDDPRVAEAWERWTVYKRQSGKPLVEASMTKQLAFLGQQPDAVACIEQSILHGWSGLFEIKERTNGTGKNGSSGARRNNVPTEQEYIDIGSEVASVLGLSRPAQ